MGLDANEKWITLLRESTAANMISIQPLNVACRELDNMNFLPIQQITYLQAKIALPTLPKWFRHLLLAAVRGNPYQHCQSWFWHSSSDSHCRKPYILSRYSQLMEENAYPRFCWHNGSTSPRTGWLPWCWRWAKIWDTPAARWRWKGWLPAGHWPPPANPHTDKTSVFSRWKPQNGAMYDWSTTQDILAMV